MRHAGPNQNPSHIAVQLARLKTNAAVFKHPTWNDAEYQV